MPKKYVVRLSEDDRAHLTERIGRGTSPAREQTRARVLLKADEDGPAWSDADIAEALDLSVAAVAGIRQRFAERGLLGAVERKRPDRVYARALDGEQEARLIQLACSTPPEGRSQWSLRLLADRMAELAHVESVSHETVRQVLKKTSLSPTSTASG